MPLKIVCENIVNIKADAIVNAANCELKYGGGVCGAIFDAAGKKELEEACKKAGYCETGKAVATEAFQINAKCIIHTPGPRWQGGSSGEEELLKSCYLNSLNLAKEHKCRSVVFPLISAGIYGYPKDLALKAAIEAVTEWEHFADTKITFALLERGTHILNETDSANLKKYIDENYKPIADIRRLRERQLSRLEQAKRSSYSRMAFEADIAESLKEESHEEVSHRRRREPRVQEERIPEDSEFNLIAPLNAYSIDAEIVFPDPEPSFSDALNDYIRDKNLKPSDIYRRANISRQLFSRISRNPDYQPTKNTALALSIGLRLDINETEEFLKKAGYAITCSKKEDIIVKFFIEHKIYNIYDVNIVLYDYGLKPLTN